MSYTVCFFTIPVTAVTEAALDGVAIRWLKNIVTKLRLTNIKCNSFNPYPTAFPYGNGMVLHFYQQQESSTTKTVHKIINKGLKAYV